MAADPALTRMRFVQIFDVGCITMAPAWNDYRASRSREWDQEQPLRPDDQRRGAAIGMLNLYSEDLDGFDSVAASFAGAGAAAVMAPHPMQVTSGAGCRPTWWNLRFSLSRYFARLA